MKSKNIVIGVLVICVVGVLLWVALRKTPAVTENTKTENAVISRNGIHYHTKLDIYIKGQLQTIPANMGLGVAHLPIHTHDADNVIHLEFSGLVTLDNTRLREFFKIWEKQFNSNCIFDNCNGPNGKITMTVNRQPNNDFEKYPMKDDDKIEIRYE